MSGVDTFLPTTASQMNGAIIAIVVSHATFCFRTVDHVSMNNDYCSGRICFPESSSDMVSSQHGFDFMPANLARPKYAFYTRDTPSTHKIMEAIDKETRDVKMGNLQAVCHGRPKQPRIRFPCAYLLER